jgi:hypothetical protein
MCSATRKPAGSEQRNRSPLSQSPPKRQPGLKSQALVTIPGKAAKLEAAQVKLRALEEESWARRSQHSTELPASSPAGPSAIKDSEDVAPEDGMVVDDEAGQWIDEPMGVDDSSAADAQVRSARKGLHQKNLQAAFASWNSLIPTLSEPLLSYLQSTKGRTLYLAQAQDWSRACVVNSVCERRNKEIVCLYWDRK